jgi:hypothetical protein
MTSAAVTLRIWLDTCCAGALAMAAAAAADLVVGYLLW